MLRPPLRSRGRSHGRADGRADGRAGWRDGARPRRRAAALAAAALAASCATYPERTASALDAYRGGHFDRAAETFADDEVVDSTFLAGAEAGMVALSAGDWERARAHFHRAAGAAEDLEDRALLSASALAEGVASIGLNDTTKAYAGEGFERVYVHVGLALAYLAEGRLEDVLVEVRRANALLEAEEELYEADYGAGGLGHFVSALAYELLGDLDDALVDYRRMAEKEVGTELAGSALVRIARELGWEEEAARWEERFGPPAEPPPGAASVVVIAGVGLGPTKVEGRLPVPTSRGIIPFAVPLHRARPQPVPGLRLVVDGEGLRTAVLEDVSDVARANLEDRVAWTAAKSAGRGVLKRQLTRELQERYDLAGRVAGDLFAFFSERADLRGWSTLPDTWQAARAFVAPGPHRLALEAVGGERVELGTFLLEPGETMVILARVLERRLYPHVIGGRPAAPAEVPEEVRS